MIRPVPKPMPRPKKARKPLRAKRWGVSRSRRGTKHSRREREWGRMAYARVYAQTQGCEVLAAMADWMQRTEPNRERALGWAFEAIGFCRGVTQYMHLHLGKTAGRRRAPDHSGAAGCERHHQDIDGRIGGKSAWYVALGFDGQQWLKHRLVERQRQRWDALTPEGRAWWDQKAAADRADEPAA